MSRGDLVFFDYPESNPDVTGYRAVFREALAKAENLFALGRPGEAAFYAQQAARKAWLRHPGDYTSAEAEDLLARLSALVPRFSSGPQRRQGQPGGRKAILHVLTKAYPLEQGGHTPLVARWIENDRDNLHSVAVTQQRFEATPAFLDEAVRRSGGTLHRLDAWSSDLFFIASSLAAWAAQFDIVILHAHPHDVVPSLAFAANPERPAVALCNHADHVFWLGASFVDTVLGIRRSGMNLAHRRRGIRHGRSAWLPIPIPKADPAKRSRAEGLARLSLPADALVALTVASKYKFAPTSRADFVQAHLPLVNEIPNLHLVVVGPSASDPYWASAEKVSSGRIRAYGVQRDLSGFRSLADVYLDSAPFGSLTSLLEAISYGVPAVSWRPHPEGDLAEIFSSDDMALEQLPLSFHDLSAYRAHVSALLQNTGERERIGSLMRQALEESHQGDGWRYRIGQVYDHIVASSGNRRTDSTPVEAASLVDDELARFQTVAIPWPESDVMEEDSHLMPWRIKMDLLGSDIGLAKKIAALAPSALGAPARRLWRQCVHSVRGGAG